MGHSIKGKVDLQHYAFLDAEDLKRLDKKESNELFDMCNSYFVHLLRPHEIIKAPPQVSTSDITDGSIKFLSLLRETEKWSEIFR